MLSRTIAAPADCPAQVDNPTRSRAVKVGTAGQQCEHKLLRGVEFGLGGARLVQGNPDVGAIKPRCGRRVGEARLGAKATDLIVGIERWAELARELCCTRAELQALYV